MTIDGAFGIDPMVDGVDYSDANGYFWRLSFQNLVAYQVMSVDAMFATPDCSGPSYMRLDVQGYRTPRLVWRRNHETTPTFYAYPDTVQPVVVNIASLLNSSGVCQSWIANGYSVYRMADAFVVARPDLSGYVLPIHPERAQ